MLGSGLIVCCIPVYWTVTATVPYGRSVDYTYTRHIYDKFSEVCRDDPGIVLSDFDDGNYIRFHTDCAVIANNMIMTPLHKQKVREVDSLFLMTAGQVAENKKWIKYIYVRRQDNILANMPLAVVQEMNIGLRGELLLNGNNLPKNYLLIKELVMKTPDGRHVPYARLFKIGQT